MTNALRNKADSQTNAAGRNGEEFLREWCWNWNQRCREVKFAKWHYVQRDKDSGSLTCRSKDGADALDVIKILNGWQPDFKGWDQDRLDSEFRILRHVARMGIPETEWANRFEKKLLRAR